MSNPRSLVIVNPQSAGGSTRRRWRRLEPRVREVLGAVEIEHTRAPRDAERMAREAVRAGIERLVVVGGDGTLQEVASGLLGAGLGGYVELGVLPTGTGNDFARTLGIPRDPEAALEVLRTGNPRRVDAGRVSYTARDGASVSAYFLNVASFGVSALTNELVRRTTQRLGGTAAFAIGTLRALLQYRCERVTLRIDGERVIDEPLVLVAAANGRHFGGGMCIAPDARLDDAWLDVVSVAQLPVTKLLAKLPKLYRGTLLQDPVVRFQRGRCIEADAPAGPVPIELDGEPLGMLPARLEIVPSALAVVGPKA